MGIKKTNYTIETIEYDDPSASSNVCRYNIDKSAFSRYYGGAGESVYFIRNTGYGTTYQIAYVRFRLQADAAGANALTVKIPHAEADGLMRYKLSKETSVPSSGWKTVLTASQKDNFTFSISPASLLPNGVYYLWICVTDSAGTGTANGNATAPVTITASGTYGAPGDITANNANFGGQVSMSFKSATSGATYDVLVKVGSRSQQTLQSGNTTGKFDWTPELEDYGSYFTTSKTVSCVITIKTYFSGTLSGTKTKTITLTFPSSSCAPGLSTGAFNIAPYNNYPNSAVSSKSGYIAGYSKIRATKDDSKISLKYGATISKWTVKFGSASAANVGAGTATKDSSTLAASNSSSSISVVCTLYDSRGFTASQTFTATTIPYAVPTLTCKVSRSLQDGTLDDLGAFMKLDFTAKYSRVQYSSTVQNSITVNVKYKLASAGSYSNYGDISVGTATQTGTYNSCTVSNKTIGTFSDAVYNIRVTLTDALGNTAVKNFTIQSAVWALHIRNKGSGAAIGKAAEANNQMQIPAGWKYYRGTYKVLDAQDFGPINKTSSLTVPTTMPTGVNSIGYVHCLQSGATVYVEAYIVRSTTEVGDWTTLATGLPAPKLIDSTPIYQYFTDANAKMARALFVRITAGGTLQFSYGHASSGTATYRFSMTYLTESY